MYFKIWIPILVTIAPVLSQEKLFLTNLIEAGRISEAKELAHVDLSSKVNGYSGFLTVNKTFSSNLFFWFIPTTLRKRRQIDQVPLILWLQGGPGTSSLFGLFVENGPFVVDSRSKLHLRKYPWTSTHSMLYIDSPIGSGFSFTQNDLGYSRTEEDVAQNLYNGLTQFFKLFPEVAQSDFYIAGESYAGKTIPVLSMKIHTENQHPNSGNFVNLKGLAIGAGFSDPLNMITGYGDYLYFTGLIGQDAREHFTKQGLLTQRLIQSGDYSQAYHIQDELFGGDFTDYPPYFKNVTGFDHYYNLLEPDFPEHPDNYDKFVQLNRIRRLIHVGNTDFERQSEKVAQELKNEIFKSVAPIMEQLLNIGYQTLLYVGQLDIVIPHLAVTNFISHMNWRGKKGYEEAERQIIHNEDDEILGYLQKYDNFNYVLVRNAGHRVPLDQPKWCLDLITRFTRGTL